MWEAVDLEAEARGLCRVLCHTGSWSPGLRTLLSHQADLPMVGTALPSLDLGRTGPGVDDPRLEKWTRAPRAPEKGGSHSPGKSHRNLSPLERPARAQKPRPLTELDSLRRRQGVWLGWQELLPALHRAGSAARLGRHWPAEPLMVKTQASCCKAHGEAQWEEVAACGRLHHVWPRPQPSALQGLPREHVREIPGPARCGPATPCAHHGEQQS